MANRRRILLVRYLVRPARLIARRADLQGNLADEPVSRILLAPIARSLTIIPLGRNSRCSSSSLPEGCSRPQSQAT